MTPLLRPGQFILLLIMLVFLAGTLGAAQAQELDLKLKGNGQVTGDFVTIGDLFDNAGGYGEIALFRAPAPGGRGLLSPARIAQALSTHGLYWRDDIGRSDIVITRAGREVPRAQITKLIAENIAKSMNKPGKAEQFDISLGARAEPVYVDATAKPTVNILQVDYSRHSGAFTALVSAPADNPKARRIVLRGTATEIRKVPVLTRAISRGEMIGSKDIEIVKTPVARISGAIMHEAAEIIGQAATRPLRAGRMLKTRDLEAPKLVTKNSLVFATYVAGNLRVQTRVRALQDGARGATITVINAKSRRRFDATVTGPGRVAVISHTPHIVTVAKR